MFLGYEIRVQGRLLKSLRCLRFYFKREVETVLSYCIFSGWNQSGDRSGNEVVRAGATTTSINGLTGIRNLTKNESVNLLIGLTLERIKKKTLPE